MAQPTPHVVVLGGPNGAGKSTTAPQLLINALQVSEFVNADDIARGLSAFHPETATIQAGRIMLRRLHELAERRATFAFETTMASRTFVGWLRRLRSAGYAVHIVFLWLPSPDMAIARVANRVRQGGHDVPVATIRRRFRRGLLNFFQFYRPLAATWLIYDNSYGGAPLRLIAQGSAGVEPEIHDSATWTRITKEAGDAY